MVHVGSEAEKRCGLNLVTLRPVLSYCYVLSLCLSFILPHSLLLPRSIFSLPQCYLHPSVFSPTIFLPNSPYSSVDSHPHIGMDREHDLCNKDNSEVVELVLNSSCFRLTTNYQLHI